MRMLRLRVFRVRRYTALKRVKPALIILKLTEQPMIVYSAAEQWLLAHPRHDPLQP